MERLDFMRVEGDSRFAGIEGGGESGQAEGGSLVGRGE